MQLIANAFGTRVPLKQLRLAAGVLVLGGWVPLAGEVWCSYASFVRGLRAAVAAHAAAKSGQKTGAAADLSPPVPFEPSAATRALVADAALASSQDLTFDAAAQEGVDRLASELHAALAETEALALESERNLVASSHLMAEADEEARRIFAREAGVLEARLMRASAELDEDERRADALRGMAREL